MSESVFAVDALYGGHSQQLSRQPVRHAVKPHPPHEDGVPLKGQGHLSEDHRRLVGEGGASCHKIHKQTSIKYSEPVSQKQILS